jgi:hypothetical protein
LRISIAVPPPRPRIADEVARTGHQGRGSGHHRRVLDGREHDGTAPSSGGIIHKAIAITYVFIVSSRLARHLPLRPDGLD